MEANNTSRRGQAIRWAIEIIVNFVLPYVIYVQTQHRIGQVDALLASSLPPLIWSVIEFFLRRRIDAVSLLVIAGIILSLLAFVGGGGVRFLQLRENLVTGLVGVVFLGSAAIGKPLIFELARAAMARKSASDANDFAQLRSSKYFRASMTIITLVWGLGLVAETILACVLVYSLPIPTYLIVSPFLGYGVMGALGVWTFFYVKHRQRIGTATRAANSG